MTREAGMMFDAFVYLAYKATMSPTATRTSSSLAILVHSKLVSGKSVDGKAGMGKTSDLIFVFWNWKFVVGFLGLFHLVFVGNPRTSLVLNIIRKLVME